MPGDSWLSSARVVLNFVFFFRFLSSVQFFPLVGWWKVKLEFYYKKYLKISVKFSECRLLDYWLMLFISHFVPHLLDTLDICIYFLDYLPSSVITMLHQLRRVDSNFSTKLFILATRQNWKTVRQMVEASFFGWSENLDGPVHAQTIAPLLPQTSRALEDARLAFRATSCDAHALIFSERSVLRKREATDWRNLQILSKLAALGSP